MSGLSLEGILLSILLPNTKQNRSDFLVGKVLNSLTILTVLHYILNIANIAKAASHKLPGKSN